MMLPQSELKKESELLMLPPSQRNKEIELQELLPNENNAGFVSPYKVRIDLPDHDSD